MKWFKTIALSCLLAAFITPKGVYSFVVDIPHIIHHYYDHNASNSMTLWGFVDEHFIKTSNHWCDTNDHKHPAENNLPTSVLGVSYCTIAQKQKFIFCPALADKVKIDLRQSICLSDVVSSIWQPPKIG